MENKKILVKSKMGQTDKCTHDQHAAWHEALSDLSSAQYDRFCRATRVWYNTTTHSFVFEDHS